MKNMTEAVKSARGAAVTKRVTNYMGGNSYELSPLEALKIVTSSSIFGEPAYYRAGEFSDAQYKVHSLFAPYSIFKGLEGKKTSEIMIEVINDALDFDFVATLEWAVNLRKNFYMRLNPQIIMVEASQHPKRKEFSSAYAGGFAHFNDQVMSRADEPASQFTYYAYKNAGKKNIPNILKRSWAKKLSSLDAYSVAKYKNEHIGMINTVRVAHATSPVLSELMKNGNVTLKSDQKTWENVISGGGTWKQVFAELRLGHMALLRNLRNIFTKESWSAQEVKDILQKLKDGVLGGKQFPFRYKSAYDMISAEASIQNKASILPIIFRCWLKLV